MDGRTIWKVVLGLVVVALLVGVGVQVYQVGMAQGMALGAQVATARTEVVPGVAPQPGVGPQPGVAPHPYTTGTERTRTGAGASHSSAY